MHNRPFRSLARTTRLATALWLAACAPVTRTGLEPLITDRPDFTESTETVVRGMRQLEAGSTFARKSDERSSTLGEVLIRVGTTQRTELRIGLNSYSMASQPGAEVHGLEDVSLGAKIKLQSGGGDGSFKPDLAVIVATSLPTGATPMRARKPQPEVKFGAAWTFTSRVAFSSNLNYALVSAASGDSHELAGTGSLSVALTPRLGSFAEFVAIRPSGAGNARSQFANGGLTYGVTDNLQFDIRAGIGLHRLRFPDHFWGAGLSRRW
jgi:Putative MetA-pathway of phenol degradation